jgi:hypothetical protein
MRALILMMLLLQSVGAQPHEETFSSNVRFEIGPLQVRLINYEVPRNKPYLIIHFEVRNPTAQPERCDWRTLVTLQRPDGTTMSSNYDVLVDNGSGGTRATGPFLLSAGGKARASVLFVLSRDDLPGRLVLPDGRRSAPIEFRGKTHSPSP